MPSGQFEAREVERRGRSNLVVVDDDFVGLSPSFSVGHIFRDVTASLSWLYFYYTSLLFRLIDCLIYIFIYMYKIECLNFPRSLISNGGCSVVTASRRPDIERRQQRRRGRAPKLHLQHGVCVVRVSHRRLLGLPSRRDFRTLEDGGHGHLYNSHR